jgi:hypothetical protein
LSGLYGAGRFGYSTQNYFPNAATAAIGAVGNADFYLDLDADSTFPFVLTGIAAQAFDGLQQSAASTVTKVNFPATTSAIAGTTMLQTFADLEAVEGFYLGNVTNAGAANQTFNLFANSLPAFTKINQGAYFPAVTVGAASYIGAASTVPLAEVGGVAITSTAAGIDLNVKPTTSTSVNGIGLTLNFFGVAGGATTEIYVNNPGRGYVAGDILTFSVAARATSAAGAGTGAAAVTLTLAAGSIPAADVISWFGLGTISAAGVTAGWVTSLAAGGVNNVTSGFVCQQTNPDVTLLTPPATREVTHPAVTPAALIVPNPNHDITSAAGIDPAANVNVTAAAPVPAPAAEVALAATENVKISPATYPLPGLFT